MRTKKPANESFISLNGDKPNFLGQLGNSSIQVDYWQIIGSLQDMIATLKAENQILKTEVKQQADEVNQLRLRVLRIEADVKEQPPLKLITKK